MRMERSSGTLARMPLAGGAARELVDGIFEADWDPEGRQLAVIREVQGMICLEYPIGRVLYRTQGWVSHVRIAPDGRSIAFLDHPYRGDDYGGVCTVDMNGNVRSLVKGFASARGLAWTASGDEIWFLFERQAVCRRCSGRGRHRSDCPNKESES